MCKKLKYLKFRKRDAINLFSKVLRITWKLRITWRSILMSFVSITLLIFNIILLFNEKLHILLYRMNETELSQIIALCAFLNTVATSAYGNIKSNQENRLHGYFDYEIRPIYNSAAKYLRIGSFALTVASSGCYVFGHRVELFVCCILAFMLTSFSLIISMYVTKLEDDKIYEVLMKKLYKDIVFGGGYKWQKAVSIGMKSAFSERCIPTIKERTEVLFFSTALENGWKLVFEAETLLENGKHKNTKEDFSAVFWYLSMEYQALQKMFQYYSMACPDQNNANEMLICELLDAVDEHKRNASRLGNYKEFAWYYYTLFLFLFLYLKKQQNWILVTQIVNRMPSLPEWDNKISILYRWTRMLAVYVCVDKGRIDIKKFHNIDCEALMWIPYKLDIDVSYLRPNIKRGIVFEKDRSLLIEASGYRWDRVRDLYTMGCVIFDILSVEGSNINAKE